MLSEQIKSGRLTCGDKLPQESEMRFNTESARAQSAKPSQMLREDGMVERTRKKGTFITEQKTPATITIMLPCPNYLSVRCISTDTLLDILDGAMSAAARHGVRVETVPASTDNTEPETIDWQNLDFISSESRVIIYGLGTVKFSLFSGNGVAGWRSAQAWPARKSLPRFRDTAGTCSH